MSKGIVKHTVVALYLPSTCSSVGKRGKPGKADKIGEDFLSIYQDNNAYPENFFKTWRHTDKLNPET